MKKLAVSLCLTALASAAFAQGTVNPANTAGTTFRTNGLALATGSGVTSGTAGGFFYEVLTAPSTVTTAGTSLVGLVDGTWSDTGLRMTNSTLASGGRENGPSGAGGIVNNWGAGVSQSFIVVGWSANLGSTWAQIASDLTGATLAGGMWSGGGFTNAVFSGNAFVGATTVQSAVSGQATGVGAFSLFGTTGTAAGTPITTSSDLFIVNVPEPTSFALAGLGMAAVLIFRRRK